MHVAPSLTHQYPSKASFRYKQHLCALLSCVAMAAYFAPATTYAKANATATTQPTSAISELALDGLSLTPRDVIDVARYNKLVAPLPASLLTIKNSHTLLLEYAKLGRPVYGLNRGVGQNKDRTIFSGDTLSAEARKLSEAFNHRMLLSHTVAYGKPAATDVVRATMLIRLNTALYGGTGMSPELVNQYVLFLNKGLTPVIKSQGSIGAADITILPQIGLAMMGEGEVEFNGRVMPATAALQEANIQPAKPYAKDSLSLLSSNAYGAAVAILATADAASVLDQADQVAALSLEGLNGNIAPLLSATQQHRPYKEQQQTAQRLLQLLLGSALWEKDEKRALQDPLSFRTISQVHGAARQAIADFHTQIAIQINSSDDNPTVVLNAVPPKNASTQESGYYVTEGPVHGAILPSASFDPTVWVLPLQNISVAMSHIAQSSAQRTLRLADPAFTQLSRFLTPNDTTLAYTTIQKPVSALVTEIRALSHPVSSDALVVAGHIEDTATNGPIAGGRLQQQMPLLHLLLGIELMHAAQAVDLRQQANPHRPIGSGTSSFMKAFRQHVSFLSEDRRLSDDIAKASQFLAKRISTP